MPTASPAGHLRALFTNLHQAQVAAGSGSELEQALLAALAELPSPLGCDAVLVAACSREDPAHVRVWASGAGGSPAAAELHGCSIKPGSEADRLARGGLRSYLGVGDCLGLVCQDGTSAAAALGLGSEACLAVPVPPSGAGRVAGLLILLFRDCPPAADPASRPQGDGTAGSTSAPHPDAVGAPLPRPAPSRKRLARSVAARLSALLAQITLLEEMAAKERETWALLRVTESVNVSFDLSEVLDSVLRESMRLLSADGGAVLLLDPHGSEHLQARVGDSEVLTHFLSLEGYSGLPGKAILDGRAYWTGDWPNDRGAGTSDQLDRIRESGMRSLLCVPLRYHGAICGCLSLCFRRPIAFRESQVASLNSLARQAVAAIDNFKLLDGLSRRAFELSAVQEVGAAVRAQQPLEEFLELVARKAADLAGVKEGAVCFLTPDGQGLLTVAGNQRIGDRGGGLQIPLGELPGGSNLSRGSAVFLDDLSSIFTDPRLAELMPGGRALMAVPLRVQDETIGSLLVFRAADAPPFKEAQIETLQVFASQASIAIENARLLQSISTAKAEWERTFDAISDLILLLDLEGRVVRCNRAFAEWMGQPVESLNGAPAHELLEQAGGCSIGEQMLSVTETTLREIEMPKLGQTQLMTSSPLYDGAGNLRGSVHVSKDITEQRRLQAHLVEGEKLRALGEMAAGVAHDFNNLLTGILGNAQMALRDPQLPESLRSQLMVVETAALDGAETVRRLQTFSKRRPSARFQLMDLSEAARYAIEVTRPKWRAEAEALGIHIEMKADLQPLPHVRGNPGEIREVITNLIINAVQAMPQGGTVEVRAWQSEGWACLSVRDTGIGMTPEVLKRVFEPFFTTKGEAGTGLGLSVSHGIVRQHGGDASVESVPGEGSTFTIRLPLQADRRPTRRDQTLVEATTPRRLLVVDDQEPVLRIIGSMLSSAGHQVHLAGSGEEALRILAERAGEQPSNGVSMDLVITDLGMPGMTGAELAARIRGLYPGLPVVLLTGWGGLPGEQKFGNSVERVLAKPIELKTLLAAVEEVTRGR